MWSESSIVTTRVAILSSWKEIASYLSQRVRTAQRWEWYLGLPVHRPHGETRSRVVAFAEHVFRDRLRRRIRNEWNGDRSITHVFIVTVLAGCRWIKRELAASMKIEGFRVTSRGGHESYCFHTLLPDSNTVASGSAVVLPIPFKYFLKKWENNVLAIVTGSVELQMLRTAILQA